MIDESSSSGLPGKSDSSGTREIAETTSHSAQRGAEVPRAEAPTRPVRGTTRSKTSPSSASPVLPSGHLIAGRYEIQQCLGRGGFGAVYRARDRELKRTVAIKQSHGLRSFVAGQIRNEAQSVASLNHPNIVAIHDLITVSEEELLIVMECLEGMTLRKRLHLSRLSVSDAIEIAIQIASALQHAHQRMLVHSDLKPANLYVCMNGTVKLLDFGLAVAYFPKETSAGNVGGTAGYMSPEQIRGESHRIDGRADIFAFGVILYEMLTGSRPFMGADAHAICDATLRKEVPPPRQLNPQIDEELQRIVLKCVEKRAIDRYDSVSALEADLQYWLDANNHVEASRLAPDQQPVGGHLQASARSSIRFPTRGLQPFTEADSESYLLLIPGGRNRDGIPDSIVFWKRWAQSDDPLNDYPVGVLYGPSGAGKTSYVRAGLLSQLDRDLLKVYIECRPGDLGGRLTRIIQSRIHEESTGSSLRELLTRLRSDDSHSLGYRKLLIVLDQFEAWSHTATLDERRDFADALRQCDGIQIRALVVTRDDYWMGVRELLRWIELPLQEGRNVASVDLLDAAHARVILETMGREAGTLPSVGEPLSYSQQQFISQAVDELTTGGYVICVHLVMFAQMVRLQEWTPSSLRGSGGVAGACSLFFQELFEKSGSRSPEYRVVSGAVAPILMELIPAEGSTVAAGIVPRSQLASAVTAAGCQHLFDDCLRILRDDLRIITVVANDPTESDATGTESAPLSEPRYRLSHDFLIEPINTWLDRVRSRTWRGRTSARLAELSDSWSRRPGRTHMPGFFEFIALLAGSRFRRRSDDEARFLKAAARLHAGRVSVAVVALIAFLGMTAYALHVRNDRNETLRRELAANIDLLFHGPADQVTTQIAKLRSFEPEASSQIEPWTESVDMQAKLRAQIYVQSLAPESIRGIAPLLEEAPPELFTPILGIAKRAPDAGPELAAIAQSPSAKASSRAAILLTYLGDSSEMEKLLAGSDDADRDQTMLLEASSWRAGPEPWTQMLASHPDPQLRYHAAVILGSYRKDDLLDASVSFDYESLINSPLAAVHSAGRFLAKHMGEDVDRFKLNPPQGAQWKVGPDNMPMVRINATEFEYAQVRNDTDQLFVLTVDDIWFSSIPVSRRLFKEFVDEVKTLPDGSQIPAVSVAGFNIPDVQKEDDSQPVLRLTVSETYAFCNWLSLRENRTPCYRYKQVKSEPQTSADYVPPEIPWDVIENATGYRVPTYHEYAYAVQAAYVTGGPPWKHAKDIGSTGGDYARPRGQEYARPLFTLIPNRLGLFVNDSEIGSWICRNDFYTGFRLGDASLIGTTDRERTSTRFAVYLVQAVASSSAD